MVRIISFNVNGIRSVNGKSKNGSKCLPSETNLLRSLTVEQSPDILCLQEIKTQNASDLSSYKDVYPHIYTNHSKARKGYSGVAILSRHAPHAVKDDFTHFTDEELGIDSNTFEPLREGRVLTAFYETYTVVCVYTPNSKDGLVRLGERLQWDELFRKYTSRLESTLCKPVIICGDLNCAYQDIDIHNSKANKKSPGFSQEERDSFTKYFSGPGSYIDTFRALHPETVKYSYWSAISRARERNAGWRIDYVLLSQSARASITSADILTEYYGSDHCPVIADIEC